MKISLNYNINYAVLKLAVETRLQGGDKIPNRLSHLSGSRHIAQRCEQCRFRYRTPRPAERLQHRLGAIWQDIRNSKPVQSGPNTAPQAPNSPRVVPAPPQHQQTRRHCFQSQLALLFALAPAPIAQQVTRFSFG